MRAEHFPGGESGRLRMGLALRGPARSTLAVTQGDTVIVDGEVVKRAGRLIGRHAERARRLVEASGELVVGRGRGMSGALSACGSAPAASAAPDRPPSPG